MVNCVVRALPPEFRVASMPLEPTLVGLFGLSNTLKKSTLNRNETFSVRLTNLSECE